MSDNRHSSDTSTVDSRRGAARRKAAAILIVDDDTGMRTALTRLLGRFGEVTAVASATEALHIVEQTQQFDLVLSDVDMPGMNGIELYVHLARVAPDLASRLVFVSGSTRAQQWKLRHGLELPLVLGKPLVMEELRAVLRRYAWNHNP